MFSKNDYWKNRKAGKRGQGEVVIPIVGYTPANEVKQGEPRSRWARRNPWKARRLGAER